MGFGSLVRALPKGTRPPEPLINENSYRTWMGGGMAITPEGALIDSPGWGTEDGLVLGIPAAWRAMNLIAGFISQLKLRTYDESTPNLEVTPAPQIVDRPWPLLTYSDYVFAMVTSLVLRGNYIAVKADYDLNGRPRQLLPVHPDDVVIEMHKGYPWYTIAGLDRELPWSEIFHVRGYLSPGSLWGVGVIEAHRKNLRYANTLADFGQQAYSNGGVPPVVIKVNKPELSEPEAEYIQQRWILRHATGNRAPAIVPGIMDVVPIGLSMQDAEYLQSRMFNVAEVAFIFNLAPEDLSASLGGGSGNSLTYANLDQKTRDRLLYSMQPIMVRIEQTYGDILPGTQTARFSSEETMRMSFKERMDAYKVAREVGAYTLDEIRILERLPPLPSGFEDPMAPKPVPPQLAVTGPDAGRLDDALKPAGNGKAASRA